MKIALFHGHGFVSWAIRFQTRGKYSHAAFITEKGEVYEAWSSGVRKLDKLKRGTDGIDLFKFSPDLSEHEEEELIKWCDSRLGRKYDYWGVFNFITRITPEEDNSKEFCSEFVTEALAAIGCPLFKNVQPWEITPNHIAWSLRLTQMIDEHKNAFFQKILYGIETQPSVLIPPCPSRGTGPLPS